MNPAMQGSIRAVSNEALISSRVACTENVRVEFLRCRTNAKVQWSVAQPELSLMWVREKAANTRVRMSGRQADSLGSEKANFWFFPEGIDAEGEMTGESEYDCAGVFVAPSFLPPTAKQILAKPIVGFSDNTLGRAFNKLMGEFTEPAEVLPLFTDGWAMQALAYVAQVGKVSQPVRATSCSGLAPWQLRRAKEMLRTDLSNSPSLDYVATACKLSVSHFTRAFKASTGLPPHQWILAARIETAQTLLANSTMSLVEVADECGFADQSHFSRVFGRMAGASPGVWRREHRV
jgi:AraC-like DNA-binding protein